MSRVLLVGLLTLLPAMAAGSAVAAKPGPDSASVYRLDSKQARVFHLESQSAGSAPYKYRNYQARIPPQLADKPYAVLIQKAAYEAALDPALVHALIFVESGYDPAARSPKGAIGLMQVLPETAARYGVPDPGRSPEANLKAGTRYLSDLMQQFDGRLDLVLAAYNAGENAVLNHDQQIPPFEETQRYVPAVLAKYRELGGAVGSARIDYLPGSRLEK